MPIAKQQVYVVYQAALFDGWEVVKEPEDTPTFFDTREEAVLHARERASRDRASLEGGALIKLENWFGDTEGVLEVSPPKGKRTQVLGYETC